MYIKIKHFYDLQWLVTMMVVTFKVHTYISYLHTALLNKIDSPDFLHLNILFKEIYIYIYRVPAELS